MENQNVLHGNKLIAEFMDCKIKDYGEDIEIVEWSDDFYPDYQHMDGAHTINNIWFDRSWDWLMPVVEKIESLKSPVYINSNCCTIYEKIDFNTDNGDLFIQSYHKTKINAVYDAVIDYIEWYNKQNNKI